jgi:mannose-6-phosphate isomerase-like protein (cupin superfamily)
MIITGDRNRERTSEVRPWGSWEVLDRGPDYKVKRITVRSHSRLSLQVHAHRAEHWVVVAGIASCTVGDRELVLGEGERVHVRLGEPHRIANHTGDDLILVELQVGDYLGEDDVVRLADDYGRCSPLT